MTMTNQITPDREHDHQDEANVIALWRQLYFYKWWLMILVLLTAALASIAVSKITPVYRATSTLLIENKVATPLSLEQLYGIDEASNEYLNTQFELLKSRSLTKRVVEKLNLDSHPEFANLPSSTPVINWRGWLGTISGWFMPKEEEAASDTSLNLEDDPLNQVISRVQQRIFVSPKAKTQLVTVSVDMTDATTATLIANAVAQEYIASQQEAKLEMAQTATQWMSTQLEELKSKLQLSEQQLQAFLEQENLLNLDGITTVSANELTNTGVRLTDARRERNAAQSMYQQVAAMKSGGYMRLASAPAVMADPVVAQFKAAEATASSRVQELSRRYGPKHPALIAATTDLNSARANLRAQVEQVVASIENSYQLTKANEQGLAASFEQNKEQIKDISRNEFRLRELQREVDTNRTLYDGFMTRLKETNASQALGASAARIIDYAVLPLFPIKPKKTLLVIFITLVVFIFSVGVILLLATFNTRFKNILGVESKLGLPVLGILPLIKNKKRLIPLLYKSGEDKTFSEAIHSIRTSLLLTVDSNKSTVILVTSSLPSEGKSAVSCNLAMALGRVDRVLLIDADLRRPSLAEYYNLPMHSPGLVDLINEDEVIRNCLYPYGSIDLLPCGTFTEHPLELLSSTRFANLIKELSKGYDKIIIDSPPVQSVSDSLILSRHADKILFVIKSDSTTVAQAKTAINKLKQIETPILGAVLNQVDIKKSAKLGDYYGVYYDHYHYSK